MKGARQEKKAIFFIFKIKGLEKIKSFLEKKRFLALSKKNIPVYLHPQSDKRSLKNKGFGSSPNSYREVEQDIIGK